MTVTGRVVGICAAGAAVAAISVGVAWAGGPPGVVEDGGLMSEAVGSGYVDDSLVGYRAGGPGNEEAKQSVVAACQAAGGTDCSADEVTNDHLCVTVVGDDDTGEVGGGAGPTAEAARDDALRHAVDSGYPFAESARTLITACP